MSKRGTYIITTPDDELTLEDVSNVRVTDGGALILKDHLGELVMGFSPQGWETIEAAGADDD